MSNWWVALQLNKEENEDFLCHQCFPGAECALGLWGSGAGVCLCLSWEAPHTHTLPAGMCIPKEGQDVEMDGDGVGTGVFLRAAAGGRGCVVTGSLSPLPAPTISSKLCPLL